VANGADVKQSGVRGGVDKQVQVAAFAVRAMASGAKDPRVERTMGQDDATYVVAMIWSAVEDFMSHTASVLVRPVYPAY